MPRRREYYHQVDSRSSTCCLSRKVLLGFLAGIGVGFSLSQCMNLSNVNSQLSDLFVSSSSIAHQTAADKAAASGTNTAQATVVSATTATTKQAPDRPPPASTTTATSVVSAQKGQVPVATQRRTTTTASVDTKPAASVVSSKAATNAPLTTSVGVTLVHCKEDWNRMSWIDEFPSHWNVTIYETCGQTVSKRYSRPWKNAGSEECTAYLQTLIETHDNPPDISIFLQSDALIGRGRASKKYHIEHSPFKTLTELIDATFTYHPTWKEDATHKAHFLHYGPPFLRIVNINAKEHYMGYHPRQVFDILQMHYLKIHEVDWPGPSQPNATRTYSRAGAQFAASPHHVQARSKELYRTLQQSILDLPTEMEARKRCMALEQLWHAVLGTPYVLRKSQTVDHLWEAKMNYYEGEYGSSQQKQRENELKTE